MPPVPTPRPCVCGGAPIAPIADHEHAIAAAVAAHNRSDQRHLAWSSMLHLERGPLVAAATDVDTLTWSPELSRELVG